MKKRFLWVAVFAALTLLFTGCPDDDSSVTNVPPGTTAISGIMLTNSAGQALQGVQSMFKDDEIIVGAQVMPANAPNQNYVLTISNLNPSGVASITETENGKYKLTALAKGSFTLNAESGGNKADGSKATTSINYNVSLLPQEIPLNLAIVNRAASPNADTTKTVPAVNSRGALEIFNNEANGSLQVTDTSFMNNATILYLERPLKIGAGETANTWIPYRMKANVRIAGLADNVAGDSANQGVAIAMMTNPEVSSSDIIHFVGMRSNLQGVKAGFITNASNVSTGTNGLAIIPSSGEEAALTSNAQPAKTTALGLADSAALKELGFREQEYVYQVERISPAQYLISVYEADGTTLIIRGIRSISNGNINNTMREENVYLYPGFVIAGVKAEISNIEFNVGENNKHNSPSATVNFAAASAPYADVVNKIVITTPQNIPEEGVDYNGVLIAVTDSAFVHQLTAFAYPASAPNSAAITWNSDKTFAKVSSAGAVTFDGNDAVLKGLADLASVTATITASCGGKTASYTYKITNADPVVTAVAVKSGDIINGHIALLTADITPYYTTDPRVKWEITAGGDKAKLVKFDGTSLGANEFPAAVYLKGTTGAVTVKITSLYGAQSDGSNPSVNVSNTVNLNILDHKNKTITYNFAEPVFAARALALYTTANTSSNVIGDILAIGGAQNLQFRDNQNTTVEGVVYNRSFNYGGASQLPDAPAGSNPAGKSRFVGLYLQGPCTISYIYSNGVAASNYMRFIRMEAADPIPSTEYNLSGQTAFSGAAGQDSFEYVNDAAWVFLAPDRNLNLFAITIAYNSNEPQTPAPPPAVNITFSAPAGIPATGASRTYTHYVSVGGTSLNIAAAVVPSQANQQITWALNAGGTTAVLANQTATTVTIQNLAPGEITLTATADTVNVNLVITVIAEPALTSIVIGAGKTTIMAGSANPAAAPEKLQFDVTSWQHNSLPKPAVTLWSIGDTNEYGTAATANGFTISSTGELTAPAAFTAGAKVFVFAAAGSVRSAGVEITLREYEPPAAVITNTWWFGDSALQALIATAGWTDYGTNGSQAMNTDISLPNNLTLTGATRTTRWLPTQGGGGFSAAGCIQTAGAGDFAKITGLPGNFTVTVKYLNTSGSEDAGRWCTAKVGATTSPNGPGALGSSSTTPSILTWEYVGTAGDLILNANNGIRIYEISVAYTPAAGFTKTTTFNFGPDTVGTGSTDVTAAGQGPYTVNGITMTFPDVAAFRWAPLQTQGEYVGRIAANGAAARNPLASLLQLQGPFEVEMHCAPSNASTAVTAHIYFDGVSQGNTGNMDGSTNVRIVNAAYTGTDKVNVTMGTPDALNFVIWRVIVKQ